MIIPRLWLIWWIWFTPRLEQEFRDSDKGKLFEQLKGSLLAELAGPSYAELGTQLGLKEDAVKQASVHPGIRIMRSPWAIRIALSGGGEREPVQKAAGHSGRGPAVIIPPLPEPPKTKNSHRIV